MRADSNKTISTGLVSVFIMILYLWGLGKFSTFYVLDDEFGYWSNGALLAGYDWSGTLRGVANYSYGYGFLLAPIINIFSSPQLAYQAAIILNCILGILTFNIILLCFKELYPKITYYKRLFIAAAICLSSSYIVNVHIAWSETLLNLLIWALIYLLTKFFNSKKILYLILASMCSTFSLMVHTRSISIVLAFLLVAIISLKKGKIVTKKKFSFFCFLVIEILIWLFLKRYFKEILWGDNAGNINDFAGELQKLFLLFSADGLFNFFIVIIGQLLYCGVSTLLLSYYSLLYLIAKTHKALIKRITSLETKEYLFVFLLACIFFTLLMGGLALINANRIDHYVYGRYIELVVIPSIGLASLELLSENFPNYKYNFGKFSVIILICSGYLIGYKISEEGASKYSIACSSALFSFIDNGKLDVNKMLLTIIVLFVLLGLIQFLFKQRYLYIIAIIMMCYSSSNALKCIDEAIIPVHENYSKIYSLVEKAHDELSDKPIYFLFDEQDYWSKSTSKAIFQLALKDRKILAKTAEELENEIGDYYLLGSNTSPFLDVPTGLSLKHSMGNYFIWGKGEQVQNYIDINQDSFFSQNRNLEIKDRYISNGQNGFLIYGPYYTLSPSNYRIQLNIKTVEREEEKPLGYFEVVSGSTILAKTEIINSEKIVLNFCLKESLDNIEFRLYVNEDVILEIGNIRIYKIEY